MDMDLIFFIYGTILLFLLFFSMLFSESLLEIIGAIIYFIFILYSTYMFWQRRKEKIYKRG